MAQHLRILQSLWAIERQRADAAEWPLQTQLAIRDAGSAPASGSSILISPGRSLASCATTA